MEFEYTFSKQACALLCQTTASVLCWTGASFCPKFKICKEKWEGRVPASPCSNQQVTYSSAPPQARNINSQRAMQPGVSLSSCWLQGPAHLLCARSRLTQALPWLMCISSVADSSAKQCLRHRLRCLGLCAGAREHRPAVTCLHCSSQQGQN